MRRCFRSGIGTFWRFPPRTVRHLALFDQDMWDKYGLATIAGPTFETNTLIVASPRRPASRTTRIPKACSGRPATRYRRCRVVASCSSPVTTRSGKITAKLIGKGVNPDRLSHEAVAAELTNHLIDGVVLTPGIVATIPELQQAGFHYAT